jgi:hypothetical protein
LVILTPTYPSSSVPELDFDFSLFSVIIASQALIWTGLKQTAGLVQIEALLRESMKDLDEAKSALRKVGKRDVKKMLAMKAEAKGEKEKAQGAREPRRRGKRGKREKGGMTL